MPLSGSLESLTPSDLLQMLMWNLQTGQLTCINKDSRQHIFLHKGEVVGATSSKYQDRLGAVLLRLGYVSDSQFEEVFPEQFSSNKPLGELFVAKKLMSTEDLEKALNIQAQDIIFEFLTWVTGEFVFEERPLEQSEFKLKPIVISTLLLEGARRRDEINRFKQSISDPDTVFSKAIDVPSAHYEKLDHASRNLLANLAVPRSLADLMNMVNETEYMIISSIHKLLEQGIIVKDINATNLRKEQKERINNLLELSVTMEQKGWFHEALSNLDEILLKNGDCVEAKEVKERIQQKVWKIVQQVFTSDESIPKVRHSVADVSLGKLYLNHREGMVFFRLDGKTNLKNLRYIIGLPKPELYIILHKFMRMGLVYLDKPKPSHLGKNGR